MPKIVPLTSYVGCQCCATFSPDGNQVAFVWDGPKHDSRDIYVKVIGTENALRLTNGQAAHSSPSWSPDGRYIAFVRFFFPSKFGVFLVPVIGGPDRKLAEIDSGGTLSWYPDGKWLAVSCQNSICALSVNTGEKRKLTVPPPRAATTTQRFLPMAEAWFSAGILRAASVSSMFLRFRRIWQERTNQSSLPSNAKSAKSPPGPQMGARLSSTLRHCLVTLSCGGFRRPAVDHHSRSSYPHRVRRRRSPAAGIALPSQKF